MGFVRGNIVGIIMELSINGKSPSDPYVKLPEGIVHIYIYIMWLKQCHKPSPKSPFAWVV